MNAVQEAIHGILRAERFAWVVEVLSEIPGLDSRLPHISISMLGDRFCFMSLHGFAEGHRFLRGRRGGMWCGSGEGDWFVCRRAMRLVC